MSFNLAPRNLNEPMQELPGASLADLITQLAEAVAEGQARLDLSSAQVLQELAQTRVSIVPSIRQTIAEGGTVSYDQAEPVEVSLLELGMLPTFFAFSEATVEVAMDLKVIEEIKSSETIKSEPILFAATRSLQTERRLNRDVKISTKMAAKLVPVPPPSRFNVTLETVTVPSPPPTLAASPNQFAPKQGITGTQVKLLGNNLNFGTPRVRFGKTDATIIGTPTANQIVVAVPSLPIGPVKIIVRTDAGSTTSKDTFNVVPLPAFATSPNQFNPKQGTPGTQVTLSGSNFNVGTPQVSFGTTAATVIGTPTADQIVVAVPSLIPAGAVKIAVQTDAGTATSTDTFNVVRPPAFAVSPNQFNPKQGTPGTQVTLLGNNFNVGTPQVSFGTTAATVIGTPTANQIVVAVPSLIPAGAVKITVQTDAGTVTSSDTFNVVSPPAFAASPNQFNPKQGIPGTQVTLSGSNFNVGTPKVSFGTTAATIIGTPTANQIVVAVPSLIPAGAVKIAVQTDAGTVTSSDTFNVVQPPAFDASPNQFNPKQGTPGTQVTLFGSNFNVGTPQVSFGTTAATPQVSFGKTAATVISTLSTNGDGLVVAVPSLIPAGAVKITVQTDVGTATSTDTFNVVQPPAFATSPNQFNPKQGIPGTQVILSGSNFNVGTPKVSFGRTTATVIGTPTANQIVVAVPSLIPAGAVKIAVQTDVGIVTSTDTFNVVQPPAFATSPNQFNLKQGTPGTQVTLSGSNFNVGTPKVSFGTTAATVIGTPTANQIVVAVPLMPAGLVKITVQTDAGNVISNDTFNVLPPSPISGSRGVAIGETLI